MALYKQGPKLRPSLGHINKIYYSILLSHTSHVKLPTWLYLTFPLSSSRTVSEMWHSTSDRSSSPILHQQPAHHPVLHSPIHIIPSTESYLYPKRDEFSLISPSAPIAAKLPYVHAVIFIGESLFLFATSWSDAPP